MKRKRYTEELVAFALRQAESGTSVAEIVRKLGVSEQTFYRWKKKYAGLGVAELRRLKQLKEPELQSIVCFVESTEVVNLAADGFRPAPIPVHRKRELRMAGLPLPPRLEEEQIC